MGEDANDCQIIRTVCRYNPEEKRQEGSQGGTGVFRQFPVNYQYYTGKVSIAPCFCGKKPFLLRSGGARTGNSSLGIVMLRLAPNYLCLALCRLLAGRTPKSIILAHLTD